MKRLIAAAVATAALAAPAGAPAADTANPFCEPATGGPPCPAEQTVTVGPVATFAGLDGGRADGGTFTAQNHSVITSSSVRATKAKAKSKHRSRAKKHRRHHRR